MLRRLVKLLRGTFRGTADRSHETPGHCSECISMYLIGGSVGVGGWAPFRTLSCTHAAPERGNAQ